MDRRCQASGDQVMPFLIRIWSLVLLLVFSLAPLADEHAPSFEEVFSAVVAVEATIPEKARTARVLGTERRGSGVLIDRQGLVLTVGYLLMEASHASITTIHGERHDAEIVAYDHDTGLGLLRSAGVSGIAPLEFGDAPGVAPGERVAVVSHGGPNGVSAVQVVDRREFAASWEYLLESAIFTAPAAGDFSGSALVNSEGKLVGIGSLYVQDATPGDRQIPGNMFIPIDGLLPILDELLEHGRRSQPGRPWLGVYLEEYRGHLLVERLAVEGPSADAGVQVNDLVAAVAGEPVSRLSEFLKAVWDLGDSGVKVPLTIVRSGAILEISVESGDRYRWLRLNPAHGITAESDRPYGVRPVAFP